MASETDRERTEAIDRYIRSGVHDDFFDAWPGGNFFERARVGTRELQDALIEEVRRRAGNVRTPSAIAKLDLVRFTRGKVEPMVKGLFPRVEQETVLAVLERSVVFLTPKTIEAVLRNEKWLSTAWDLANLYLASAGAETLGGTAPRIVGLSCETTCYVSMNYFETEEPFADFVVHEAAHVFHNCKRETIGLSFTRNKEWPLALRYEKRETFAYACEIYSRILESALRPADRAEAVEMLARSWAPPDERVDTGEFFDILRDAIAARNGWKIIHKRCSPLKPLSRAAQKRQLVAMARNPSHSPGDSAANPEVL